MKGEVLQRVVCDTCFWFALLCGDDGNHKRAEEIRDAIERFYVIVPWPVLYETIDTGLVKNRERVEAFQRLLDEPGIQIFDDAPYRQQALEDAKKDARSLSLVDRVLRHILADCGTRVDYLVTFNVKDFVDVCRERKIVMHTQYY
jgi:predicted nucleic acid-binding protein